MVELKAKEVRYDKYCPTCKYSSLKDTDEPCDSCIEQFHNDGTDKPIKYEERENGTNRNHKRKVPEGR